MNNLAIVPARSGSKGLKDKNIKLLHNKPLLAYTIEAALDSNIFDEVMVSTDSNAYADIAKKIGASVPFLRSAQLSNDVASSWDVVKDILIQYKALGQSYDVVTLLQPTSPLRTAQDIKHAWTFFTEKKANFVASVCQADHSPLWMGTLPDDLSLNNFIDRDIANKPRQQLDTYYRFNGAVYMVKTDYLCCVDNLYSDKSYAFVMDVEHSVDIDNELDFRLAEKIIDLGWLSKY